MDLYLITKLIKVLVFSDGDLHAFFPMPETWKDHERGKKKLKKH